MRRLARHLFTLCSAVSLLLCVAVCVLWVRNCLIDDHLAGNDAGPDDGDQPAHARVACELVVRDSTKGWRISRHYRAAPS